MSESVVSETSVIKRRGHPGKRPGESFGQYWLGISDQEAIGIALASKRIGVTPQSIFVSYLRDEAEHG